MKILSSPLTGNFYAVKDNYKPGHSKYDVTESVGMLITNDRALVIEECAKIADELDVHCPKCKTHIMGISRGDLLRELVLARLK